MDPSDTNPYPAGTLLWRIWVLHHLTQSTAVAATLTAVLGDVDPTALGDDDKATLVDIAEEQVGYATGVVRTLANL